MGKSLFGKYNPFIDEFGHALLNLLIILPFRFTGLISNTDSLYLFFLGILLDLDHLLNPLIARIFGTIATIIPSTKQKGVTVKIFHGIDISAVIATMLYIFGGDIYLSICAFLVMTVHELWDYIVYDHNYKELFLFTRIKSKFKPGVRKKHVGIIFNQDSLSR